MLTEPAMPLLTTSDLTKTFGRLTALRRQNIVVRTGEIVGVIGPNGSGKSTFFNLVTGFLRPDSGEVKLDGRPIQCLAPARIARLGIARTFQGARLFASLSVLENVRAAAQLRHPSTMLDAVLVP
jgi:branched-chain amino acid transport system ATP-binding protein